MRIKNQESFIKHLGRISSIVSKIPTKIHAQDNVLTMQTTSEKVWRELYDGAILPTS